MPCKSATSVTKNLRATDNLLCNELWLSFRSDYYPNFMDLKLHTQHYWSYLHQRVVDNLDVNTPKMIWVRWWEVLVLPAVTKFCRMSQVHILIHFFSPECKEMHMFRPFLHTVNAGLLMWLYGKNIVLFFKYKDRMYKLKVGFHLFCLIKKATFGPDLVFSEILYTWTVLIGSFVWMVLFWG